MADNHIPGLSVAVIKEGKIVVAKGYGFSNLELRTPATKETAYAIYSITKSMTAILVMMLAEEGKVSIDRSINEYIPGLPEAWNKVTVKHLLNHTSGLPDLCDAAEKPCDRSDPFTPAQVIGFVRNMPLMSAPGERWEYSNTGYLLLGVLIEKISGGTYAEFVSERIFKPLKMNNSRLDDFGAVIKNRAAGYTWKGSGYVNAIRANPTFTFSLGGVVSTVSDLAKYDAALYTDKLLPQATLQRMWTKAVLNDGTTVDCGLGFGLSPYLGNRRVGHSGGHAGFASSITRLIDHKVSVVILSNADSEGYEKDSGGFLISDIANEIASYYFKR